MRSERNISLQFVYRVPSDLRSLLRLLGLLISITCDGESLKYGCLPKDNWIVISNNISYRSLYCYQLVIIFIDNNLAWSKTNQRWEFFAFRVKEFILQRKKRKSQTPEPANICDRKGILWACKFQKPLFEQHCTSICYSAFLRHSKYI